jgi:D-sedoheptulose 7-phosphate isomerase
VCVRIPSTDTPRIQESHILLGHVWAELIEAAVVAAER